MKKSDDTIIKSIKMPRNTSRVVHYRAKCDKTFCFYSFRYVFGDVSRAVQR